jgi:hypothetical protein
MIGLHACVSGLWSAVVCRWRKPSHTKSIHNQPFYVNRV